MPETEDGGEHGGDRLRELLPRAADTRLGRARRGGELERSLDGESREVDVVLRAVLHIAAELLVELLGFDGVVIHLPRDRMILCALVGDSLEERAAS